MTQLQTDPAAEAALLQAYAAGESDAARELATRYTPSGVRTCLSDAERSRRKPKMSRKKRC
ncbi:hypothetical protein [Marivita sp.]|uniref:hypothetical protein n=1 Tax=Marivita sp. TaxID=2003365 RepID=UPI003B59FA25